MAIVEIDSPDLLATPAEHDQVPVILGIALQEDDRRRLASRLTGAGVLMFAPDLLTACAVLEGQAAPFRAAAEPELEPEPVVRLGELEVDPARCRARWRDTPLPLTQRERALLAGLAVEPSRVWTHRQLHAVAWTGGYLDPGPVHAAVKRLRRKLQQAGAAVRIEAVRGVGYRLVETGS